MRNYFAPLGCNEFRRGRFYIRPTIRQDDYKLQVTCLILNTNKTIDKKSAQNPYIRVFA